MQNFVIFWFIEGFKKAIWSSVRPVGVRSQLMEFLVMRGFFPKMNEIFADGLAVSRAIKSYL